jgi:hypothetical protein
MTIHTQQTLGHVLTSRGKAFVKVMPTTHVVTLAMGPGALLELTVAASDVPQLASMLLQAARLALQEANA